MQISPVFNLPAFTDSAGEPLAGGQIFAYEAGSFSVLKRTYTSQDGSVENSNPIVLDSAGKLPQGVAIWLEDGELYNLVLTAADGTTVLQVFDEVSGVPVPSTGGGGSTAIWVETPGATYLSPTSFLVPGNFAVQYSTGNRVRLTLSTGYTYGTVSSSSFSSPNTSVTIINDGAVLNSSLSMAEYSVLVVNAETVDAGAVSYTSALSYSTANTVGNKLKSLDTDIAGVEAKRARGRLVYETTGTGDTYVITPSPAITSYTAEASFVVKFANAATGGSTLNINGVGAKALKQYESDGTRVDAIIAAGMVSEVAYDAANDVFIVLDPLPAAAPAAFIAPRGYQAFTSNGTFTVPANVYYIKVTCVGGGGGGGGAINVGDIESGDNWKPGGSGGGGAVVFKYLSVTPGATYTCAIGAGGTGVGSGTAGNGGQTSFGVTLVTAQGGFGATSAASSFSPGVGGAGGGTGTGFVIRGGNGGNGQVTGLFGGVGGTGGAAPGFGESDREYGGGGSGGTGFPSAGGNNGRPGLVLVEW